MVRVGCAGIPNLSSRKGEVWAWLGELRCWIPAIEYYATVTLAGADCLSAEMIKQTQGTYEILN